MSDIEGPKRGKGRMRIVGSTATDTDERVNQIMRELGQMFYLRGELQDFMEHRDLDECQCFYIDITVRRGRIYKRKKHEPG